MVTEVLPCDDAGIEKAARLIAQGQVVAFPTETVYGLGADAENEAAVRGIFAAKDRPADNPLIVHISQNEQVLRFAKGLPRDAERLMQAFWPGPLTMILEQKPDALPAVTTAGLSTFAVRRPSHPVAVRLIEASGCAIAAPSANRSGAPSPTDAAHVLQDMDERIPLILDGGPSEIGLESTVISLLGGGVVILRPGGVTQEMLEDVLGGHVPFAGGVDRPVDDNEAALSPGMKHRHYAPDAQMTVVDGLERMLALYDAALDAGELPVLMTTNPEKCGGRRTMDLGDKPWHTLFRALREANAMGATRIFFEAVPESGVGRAVMNRALRAAGFQREG